jgi:hypothetical protein
MRGPFGVTMLSQDKTGLLQTFLGSLPGDIALRLARAVEVDRLMDGTALPHDVILDGLRPVLRCRERENRTPTPLRLFCQPFEDILSSAPRGKKQKASIDRASVLPVWLWVSQTLMPEHAEVFIADTKALVLAQKLDEATLRAGQFWTLAGLRIRETLADNAGRKAAKDALKDEMVLADADEMALLLLTGTDILKIQAVLPKYVPLLSEDLLWQLRAIYDELVVRNPDAAPYVAVVTMNRLVKPWEALRLPLMISRQTSDTLISQTDMGLVGEILFNRLDALQAVILSTRHPLFEAGTLLAQVQNFAELSSAVVKEIEVRRDGEWGHRLMKDRAAVGNAMENFMDRAPKEFAAALPLQKSAGPKTADFSRPGDAAKQAMAIRYAKLVVGCRNFAAAASFGAKQKAIYEEMCGYLRRHNEDLVKELRGSDSDRRTNAESQFDFCCELTALLFSEEEAELLRRRGRAAQAAA